MLPIVIVAQGHHYDTYVPVSKEVKACQTKKCHADENNFKILSFHLDYIHYNASVKFITNLLNCIVASNAVMVILNIQ